MFDLTKRATRAWAAAALPRLAGARALLAAAIALAAFVPSAVEGRSVSRHAAPNPARSSDDLPAALQLFRSGQYDECLSATVAALRSPNAGRAWYELHLRVLLTTGRYAEAVEAQQIALQHFRDSITFRRLGAEALRFQNRTAEAREMEQEIFDLVRRISWNYDSAAERVLLGRMLLERGGDPKQILKDFFQPHIASDYQANLAIGQLALDKGDYALAAEHFQAAIDLQGDDPDAHFGLADAYRPSDLEKSTAALQEALRLNPRHIPSLLHLAENRIDAEQFDEAEQFLAQVLAVHPNQPRALAFRAVIAHLNNQPATEGQLRKQALSTWAGNPEVDHWIGKKLSQKYRFREGAEYQRRALVYDDQYLPAKIQLTQDLLRLGQELEGWKLADEVNLADGYNILAHNLVTLRDHMAAYTTLRTDDFVVRMDAREAKVYGGRVLELLAKAKSELAAKYQVEITRPVTVEIFSRQADFAIRTFGMPGGAGFLGVSFGEVVTMNSPASQGATPSNWQSVLWHEFCHVVTLQKTHNKMPRWLSEGISVYEERQANPAWGQAMNARFREMILSDDLTPVSQLSGAFLEPASPQHLQFAYYESSLVVEYLVEKFGPELLNRLLLDLGIGMTMSESLSRYVGSSELFDQEFAEYIRGRAAAFAPDVDFELPEDLPPLDSPAALQAAADAQPRNFPLQLQLAQALIADREWVQARAVVERLIELVPAYRGANSPYQFLAAIQRETGDAAAEQEALRQWVALDPDEFAGRMRLAELAAAAEQWDEVARYAEEAIGIDPLVAAPHRWLQRSAAARNDGNAQILALEALLELDPADPAQLHYQLAAALWGEQQSDRARRQVLMALEFAPRFRDAQRLLLEIADREDGAPAAATDRAAEAAASDSNTGG